MAQKEREKIRKRQAEGIKRAKENGKHLGRPKIKTNNFDDYYKKVYIDNEMTAVNAMEELNISKTTFYRKKREYEKKNNISN